ncbi:MAG TPA: c-type cytochrome [Burkholderiales bacterium]|nr:c-type cytochrome [Burkholderiales bacterium]
MKPIVRISAGLAIVVGLLASAAATAAAPVSFAACAACHSVDGKQGLGPSMKGVVGRKAGAEAGFSFSQAMRNAKVTWDEKTLDAFLADPQKVVPGNAMPFPGVADAKQRAEIVDYLKTVH